MEVGSRVLFLMLVFTPLLKFYNDLMRSVIPHLKTFSCSAHTRVFPLNTRWWCNGPSESGKKQFGCCIAGYQGWGRLPYIMHSKHMKALWGTRNTVAGAFMQELKTCPHICMCTHNAGEAILYILSRYLRKRDLKSLNYVSGQMLCLLTPHYTHSPLSHFSERGTENASRSFSQEWLTFRKTERKKQMGRRGVRQKETSYILTNESSV